MITADYYRLMAEYNAWMNGIAGRRGPRLECWIRRRIGDIGEVRISAIVDACFRLIVDGKSALPLTRWGGTQVLG